jgi:putative transposase
MVKYRRYRVPGGTYFFTLTLRDRKSDWLTRYCGQVINAMKKVRAIHPFKTIALVILPDHLHAMWTLPDGDSNYSLRWRLIKTQFSKNLASSGISIKKNAKGENILWQNRFWEHTIRNEIDYEKHVNYIHYNPVKHGFVTKPADWPYTTFHRYVKNGILPYDWCHQECDIDVE